MEYPTARIEHGLAYERWDRDEWTPLCHEFESRRAAEGHADILRSSPDVWRNVRVVARVITDWMDAE